MTDKLEEKLDRLSVLCDRVPEERTFSSNTYYCMKEELPRLLKAVREIIHMNNRYCACGGNDCCYPDVLNNKLESILLNKEAQDEQG